MSPLQRPYNMSQCIDCNLLQIFLHFLIHDWGWKAFFLLPILIIYGVKQYLKAQHAKTMLLAFLPFRRTRRNVCLWLVFYVFLVPLEILEVVWIMDWERKNIFPATQWKLRKDQWGWRFVQVMTYLWIMIVLPILVGLYLLILGLTGAAVRELWLWLLYGDLVVLDKNNASGKETNLEQGWWIDDDGFGYDWRARKGLGERKFLSEEAAREMMAEVDRKDVSMKSQ